MLARAQQSMPVIGFASGSTVKLAARNLAGYREGLAEHGYVEDKNYRFELLEANNQYDLLPTLFRELVDKKVSVIITDSTLKLELAKAATQSIPTVFSIGVDPVESGYVASLNKPGGNITGVFNLVAMLGAKQVEMLHELVPTATKFAFLIDPRNTTNSNARAAHLQAAADSLGLSLLRVNTRSLDEFEAAFEAAVRGGAGGMIVGIEPLLSLGSPQLVALAERYRLPAIYLDAQIAKAGGLVTYSSDKDEDNRVQGRCVARILKGVKPADIPVMQSTKTIMAINLKTAKVLGITVPTTLLGRADEVIE